MYSIDFVEEMKATADNTAAEEFEDDFF